MKPRYSVIIPAHNEASRIEPTLREYAAEFDDSEILVILNGCTDITAAIVERLTLEYRNVKHLVIDHPVGKGGAVRAGFLIARGDHVGFVDADGSTPARELRRLFGCLVRAEVVVGSRWKSGARVTNAQPFRRRIASRVFNALVRLFFGLPFQDTQCGAKVFSADALSQVIGCVDTSNMAFDVDLLYALKRAGITFHEEPTEWHDKAGSCVSLASASARMLGALLRLRMRYSALRLIVPVFDALYPTNPIRAHDGFSILILNWRDPQHPQAGGAETYLFELARRWVKCGNRVEWLTAGFKGGAQHEELHGVGITRVGNALTVYLALPWMYVRRFRDRFDVVIDAENGIPFFSPLFSLKPKLCLIFHVHKRVFQEQLPKWISWFFVLLETKVMPYVYRNSRFVTISKTSHDEMLENRFSEKPVDVVYSGVGVECEPGAKSAVPTVAYVGRLKPYKRVDLLIRAFPGVLDQIPAARLVIAGSGDAESKLRELIDELGLADRVEIRGFVDEATKIQILQQAWLFVTPSSMEGWGIAAIEANACGTPVVAYDVPGLREAIVSGMNGVLLPNGSDLTPTIVDILADRERRAPRVNPDAQEGMDRK